jgi:hypothetical protein
VALSCLFFAFPILAAEKEDAPRVDSTTKKLILQLQQQGVLTQEQADALLRDGEKVNTGVVRVPYVPETIKNEMREEIKREVLEQARKERWGDPGTLPEWLGRIKWDGDIRVRYEKDMFPVGNSGQTPNFQAINSAGGIDNAGANAVINDSEDRDRLRLRLRLGMLAKVNDKLEAGLRLATGSTSDPVSTNQTLGNSFNHNAIVLDRAYLRYDPRPALTLWGGKIPNPWLGTDLVWDEDLNFDGLAASVKPSLGDHITGFGTIGWFPLQEIERSASDKYLTGTQIGFDWKPSAAHNVKVGLAYYNYHHISGQHTDSEALDYLAPQFVQKGNSMFHMRDDTPITTGLFALAPDYKEMNLTAVWDIASFDPAHVVVLGDYVKNVGFDQEAILQRTGRNIEPKTNGYQVKVALGMPVMKRRADWQFTMAYKYLERDAVVDAFTDSDFHLGGTDAKGWILGGSFGMAANTWLTLRWLTSDTIDGYTLAVDVLQLDVNARF